MAARKKDDQLNEKLAIAAGEGDLPSVKKLLKENVDINAKADPSYGRTPLTNACKNIHIEVVKELLNAGADVNCPDRDDTSPLLAACDAYERGLIGPLVKMLLDHGAVTKLHKKGNDGPLHYAAMFGHLDAVKLLVEHGANVNAKGDYKRTPLIYAASCAHSPEMCKVLIEAGADLHAKNESGENALFELITDDDANADVARILIDAGLDIHIKHSSYGTALHWAAFCGRKNIIEVLLEKGARVNEKDAVGETAIVRAFSKDKLDIVKLLFDHGADADSSGQFGYSLLEFATITGDTGFAKKIIKRSEEQKKNEGSKKKKTKKKVIKKSKKNAEALVSAAKEGDLEMVKLLIESGFDVDGKNSWGSETPLIKAAYNGRLKVVQYLIEKGADIKARDSRGNTALLHAAWSGHKKVVSFLLDHGAEINEKNKLNWNALMQASIENHYNVVKLLLDRGSPTDEIDKEKGATALTLAKHINATELVELLKSRGAKERTIRMRKEDEDYFSIIDCDICFYLEHTKNLNRTEYPEDIAGLVTIHVERTEPDRYTEDTDMIEKCPNCGTYYHQSHSIDSEDAFVAGPSIHQTFQRYNFLKIMKVLALLKKRDELNELKKRYPDIIKNFFHLVKENHAVIRPNIMPHVIETLTDYFIMQKNWKSLRNDLLKHDNHQIALITADGLIKIYGERFSAGVSLFFTYYRNFTKEVQESAQPLLNLHKDDFVDCIIELRDNSSEDVVKKCDKILDSAVSYKLIKKKKVKKKK